MTSTVCLSACASPNNNSIRRLSWNLARSHAIEGDLDVIILQSRAFNHSKIADVQTSEMDAKFQPTWEHKDW
jgi:hypothetical protein